MRIVVQVPEAGTHSLGKALTGFHYWALTIVVTIGSIGTLTTYVACWPKLVSPQLGVPEVPSLPRQTNGLFVVVVAGVIVVGFTA